MAPTSPPAHLNALQSLRCLQLECCRSVGLCVAISDHRHNNVGKRGHRVRHCDEQQTKETCAIAVVRHAVSAPHSKSRAHDTDAGTCTASCSSAYRYCSSMGVRAHPPQTRLQQSTCMHDSSCTCTLSVRGKRSGHRSVSERSLLASGKRPMRHSSEQWRSSNASSAATGPALYTCCG